MSSAMLGLLLFLSGGSALVYQLLWIKQLSIVVGVDVYAVTIAISAFFVGLGGGGLYCGRAADRNPRPLRLYAAIEAATALMAVGATFVLARSAAVFAAAQTHLGPAAWLLPFALVGVPALLMGGTLPVLARADSSPAVARSGGSLYAANTLGAVAGVLAAAFLLIPRFGLFGSALVAGAGNVLAGLAAFVLDRGPARATSRPSIAPARLSHDRRTALVMYALAGAIALGYEVVWSQVVVQFMSTRSVAFAVMLVTYLAGLTIGSALYARWADRVRDPFGVFGLLIAGAGLAALLLAASAGYTLMRVQSDLEGVLRTATGSELLAMLGRFSLASVALVLLPTLLMGAAFPAALKVSAGPDRVGRDLGTLVALNTAGGVAGSLVTGFVL